MFDGRWREAVDRTTTPVGRWLQRHGMTADVLTATGLVSAVGTAVAVATGHFYVAVVLLILTGAHDLFDGPVAKAAGTSSVRGAFFDSVTDRVADGLLMGGVAWYLVSAHRGHLVLLPLAILGVTALISYQRAKAESLGLSAKGGLMERAERMILLGIGFLATWLLVPVLWALLALTSMTAIGRFVKVWQAAAGPPRVEVPVEAPQADAVPRWGQGRVESRWRAWREDRALRGGPARTRTFGAGGTRTVGRAGEPLGRWRARRQESLASRTGRARRARRLSHRSSTSHRP